MSGVLDISIPEGAIETRAGLPNARRDVLFQYPKVRLRLWAGDSPILRNGISIPEGAIETLIGGLEEQVFGTFQYPKVRLRQQAG